MWNGVGMSYVLHDEADWGQGYGSDALRLMSQVVLEHARGLLPLLAGHADSFVTRQVALSATGLRKMTPVVSTGPSS